MKIAAFASFAPSLTRFRGHLLAAMVTAGHQVIASAPDISRQVRDELAAVGVRCHELRLNRRGLNPTQDLQYLGRVFRFLKRERIDACFFYTIKPVIFGSLAARAARVPAAFSLITGLGYTFVGNSFSARCLSVISSRLYRLALQNNRIVFFQNPDDRDLFVLRGLVEPDKTRVVNGSGVDLQFYAPAPIPPGGPEFLMIARLLRAKGVVEYATAAEIVKKQFPHCRFRLIGPEEKGPDSIRVADLAPWIERGTLEYLGETQDVRPFLRECSVYVLPSYREGTPRSVLEAMACGRPIITTAAPGCRQTVLEGDNGFLVPPRDFEKLAAAMRRFSADPQLAVTMGAKSRAMAEQNFDVNRINRQMLEAMGLRGSMAAQAAGVQ